MPSYQTISIRKAIDRINSDNNGWFLPATQRQYEWGSRDESEMYICKLFDSIVNEYPIGTIVIWNTEKRVPYREFVEDYNDGDFQEQVDQSLYDRKDKWLVYDGQQRLQTLYSCLRKTINGRVLHYDLLFNKNNNDDELYYGFKFFDKNSDNIPVNFVSMPKLYSLKNESKYDFKSQIESEINQPSKNQIIEENIDNLWSAFNDDSKDLIAYFPINSDWDLDKVNEIFQRINTSGVPLSQADLLLSRIKETYYDFESELVNISGQIEKSTAGYTFSAQEILQLIYLIYKETTRVDASRDVISGEDIDELVKIGRKIKNSLTDFFNLFIFEDFHINNERIIKKKLALLPLMVYTYYYTETTDKQYRTIDNSDIEAMKKYFVLSQLNDWNTQGFISKSIRIIKKVFESETSSPHFPYNEVEILASEANRLVNVSVETIERNEWFALKVLMPHRTFIKEPVAGTRYKPEIDHIYPTNLQDRPIDYNVNVVWNKQPVNGEVNDAKKRIHPREFFTDNKYQKWWGYFDYLAHDSNDPACAEWNDYKLFIKNRKERMINKFVELYKFDVKS